MADTFVCEHLRDSSRVLMGLRRLHAESPDPIRGSTRVENGKRVRALLDQPPIGLDGALDRQHNFAGRSIPAGHPTDAGRKPLVFFPCTPHALVHLGRVALVTPNDGQDPLPESVP